MTLAFLGGRLLWKDVHVLNTIAASAFVLLLSNPASLFDIGFQLTYAATLTIILFTPPLLAKLPRLPFKTAELAGLSVTAALGASPIVARSFNRVAFSSLILNFPAIPLVGLIMGVGYAFLPFAAAFPGAAGPPAALLRLLVAVFALDLPFARRLPLPVHPRPDAAGGAPLGLLHRPGPPPRPAAVPLPASGRFLGVRPLPRPPRPFAVPAGLPRASGHHDRRRAGRVHPGRIPRPQDHAHRRRRARREPVRRRGEGRFPGPLAQGDQAHRHPGPDPSRIPTTSAGFWPSPGTSGSASSGRAGRPPKKGSTRPLSGPCGQEPSGAAAASGPISKRAPSRSMSSIPLRPPRRAGPVPAANESSLVIKMTHGRRLLPLHGRRRPGDGEGPHRRRPRPRKRRAQGRAPRQRRLDVCGASGRRPAPDRPRFRRRGEYLRLPQPGLPGPVRAGPAPRSSGRTSTARSRSGPTAPPWPSGPRRPEDPGRTRTSV